MSDLLHRVHEAKARYTAKHGEWPTQLFLGPKEYLEFKEMCAEYATHHLCADGVDRRDGPGECAGMTIIGLMSDGLRVGITTE